MLYFLLKKYLRECETNNVIYINHLIFSFELLMQGKELLGKWEGIGILLRQEGEKKDGGAVK